MLCIPVSMTLNIDLLFLCGHSKDVMPVRKVANIRYPKFSIQSKAATIA